MTKEPKTAEQINTDKLLLWINRYLTRRFITDPDRLPEDECEKEAKVILDKCREQIRQQLIGEMAHFLHGEISKEKLAENLGINFYELDNLLRFWLPKETAILSAYRNDAECQECGSIITITLNQLMEILGGNNSREVNDGAPH